MKTKALERSDKLTLPKTDASQAFALLVALTRELVRHASTDLLILSVFSAASKVGVSKERAVEVLKPVLEYKGQNDAWPEGFMS
jgi:hypothetical protein